MKDDIQEIQFTIPKRSETTSGFKFSGYTKQKQSDLMHIFAHHMAHVGAILKGHAWSDDSYLYIDLHAGLGYDSTLNIGSPLRAIYQAHLRNLPAKFIFLEKDFETYNYLKSLIFGTLTPFDSVPSSVSSEIIKHCQGIGIYLTPCDIAMNNSILLQALKAVDEYKNNISILNLDHNSYGFFPNKKVFGLVYADPSNGEIPTKPLATVSHKLPKLDILINLSANSHKRKGGYKLKRGLDYPRIFQEIKSLKTHWWIREVDGTAHQWTMLFGSNNSEIKTFKSLYGAWHSLETKEGKYWLDIISHTKQETDLLEKANITSSAIQHGLF